MPVINIPHILVIVNRFAKLISFCNIIVLFFQYFIWCFFKIGLILLKLCGTMLLQRKKTSTPILALIPSFRLSTHKVVRRRYKFYKWAKPTRLRPQSYLLMERSYVLTNFYQRKKTSTANTRLNFRLFQTKHPQRWSDVGRNNIVSNAH
jgi:hypothetical protein